MAGPVTDLEGVLLIDKPTGMTSHDVVNRVRRKLHMKRIGHAGTLDPLATGLLIILVGKATKISQYLMSLDKEYSGTMKLGETTDTQDSDGEVMQTRPVPELTAERIEAAMAEFVGDQYQTPPMYSAKKIGGVPLYKMARKGKEVEREARFIHVHAFELIEMNLPEVEFFVRCSKGTYIRTLANDLGEKLGCGAHLTELCREQIERFDIENAVTLEDFEQMEILRIREILIPKARAVPTQAL